eukprot:1157218-Pelagomonas_calceolata.AAC.4
MSQALKTPGLLCTLPMPHRLMQPSKLVVHTPLALQAHAAKQACCARSPCPIGSCSQANLLRTLPLLYRLVQQSTALQIRAQRLQGL